VQNEDNGADTGDAMEVWTIRGRDSNSSTPPRKVYPSPRVEGEQDDKEQYNHLILRVQDRISEQDRGDELIEEDDLDARFSQSCMVAPALQQIAS
jgi:hypothetical protein